MVLWDEGISGWDRDHGGDADHDLCRPTTCSPWTKWTRSCVLAGQGPYPRCSIYSKVRKQKDPVLGPYMTDASKLKPLRRPWRNEQA